MTINKYISTSLVLSLLCMQSTGVFSQSTPQNTTSSTQIMAFGFYWQDGVQKPIYVCDFKSFAQNKALGCVYVIQHQGLDARSYAERLATGKLRWAQNHHQVKASEMVSVSWRGTPLIHTQYVCRIHWGEQGVYPGLVNYQADHCVAMTPDHHSIQSKEYDVLVVEK